MKQSTKQVQEVAWILLQSEIRALNNSNIRASIGAEIMNKPHEEVMRAYYPVYIKNSMKRYDALLRLGEIAETRTAKEFLKKCVHDYNKYYSQHLKFLQRYLSDEE